MKSFETEEEQEQNERFIKDKIMENIRTLFEQEEEDCYNPKE